MATKKKRSKKVNYVEFLAWLEGVESMQAGDWTPSPVQWKTIREKLNSVTPDVETREVKVKSTTQAARPPMTSDTSTFDGPAPAPLQPMPPQAPIPLRPQISAHQRPSEHEGVPASTNGPFVDAQGNLQKDEFL